MLPSSQAPFVNESGHIHAAWHLFLSRVHTWVGPPATLTSPGTQGQLAYDQGSLYICTRKNTWLKFTPGGGGGGTVSSVGLTMPPEFGVSGSPVTSSGTLAVSKSNENANTFAAGPASGSPAPWGFRFVQMPDLPADAVTSVAGITIDGGSSSPTTGVKGSIQVPFPGTIIGWSAIADAAGSLTIEVDKHASSPPPNAPSIPNTTTDKISASAPIVLSSAQSASGDAGAVSTWNTAVAQWDSIQFNLTSIATIKRVTVGVVIKRT